MAPDNDEVLGRPSSSQLQPSPPARVMRCSTDNQRLHWGGVPMRARRFALWKFLAAVQLAGVICVADPASAQSDAQLKALDRRVERLNDAGKYTEALAVAEAYVQAAKKRHGEQHPAYAKAIGWLAQLLQQTDRPAEAEPLYRRALAIEEK